MTMTIGLTYDLRSEYLAMGYSELDTAEFDREDTVISIENALHALGHRTVPALLASCRRGSAPQVPGANRRGEVSGDRRVVHRHH